MAVAIDSFMSFLDETVFCFLYVPSCVFQDALSSKFISCDRREQFVYLNKRETKIRA